MPDTLYWYIVGFLSGGLVVLITVWIFDRWENEEVDE